MLLLAGILSAPWNGVTGAAASWGLLGLAGIIYELIVTRRMRTQTAYRPELEDWLFHSLLPIAAYVILGVSAFVARYFLRNVLFCVAGTALLLLFIGIHNAWDAVTYHVFVQRQKHQTPEQNQ